MVQLESSTEIESYVTMRRNAIANKHQALWRHQTGSDTNRMHAVLILAFRLSECGHVIVVTKWALTFTNDSLS